MTKNRLNGVRCQICKKQKNPGEMIPAELVSESVAEIIRKEYPDWSSEGAICISDLNDFRAKYVKNILQQEKGELSVPEKQVVESLEERELLSRNVNTEFDKGLKYGERMADRLSDIAGSWKFIIGFAFVLVIWIILNTVILLSHSFDPYPFILLNLVLSCLAAIQAPIILMSQNRQEAKDRLQAENDYKTNLKAELEIRHLHNKIDHLIKSQWQRLLEIQEIQTELIEEFTHNKNRK